jgi:transposase
MDNERVSLVGRPRLLGEAQIERVLNWYRNRLTLEDLARELKVSAATLRRVIRTQGRDYKQPPPERRAEAIEAVRRRRAVMAQEGLE